MAKNYETEQVVSINEVPYGEMVRLLKAGVPQRTTWVRGAYDRSSKRYSLSDSEDMNRETFKKSGTKVFVGFTY